MDLADLHNKIESQVEKALISGMMKNYEVRAAIHRGISARLEGKLPGVDAQRTIDFCDDNILEVMLTHLKSDMAVKSSQYNPEDITKVMDSAVAAGMKEVAEELTRGGKGVQQHR